MAQSFLKLVIAFSLVGLMVYGIIIFGYNLQRENYANETILEHSTLQNVTIKLNESLSLQEDESEKQRGGFEGQTTSTSIGFFMLDAVISGGRIFTGMLMLIYNLTLNSSLVTRTLGIPRIVISVITSILLVSIIFLLWRTYKAGG